MVGFLNLNELNFSPKMNFLSQEIDQFEREDDKLRPEFSDEQKAKINQENQGLKAYDANYKNFFPYDVHYSSECAFLEESPHGHLTEQSFYSLSKDGKEMSFVHVDTAEWYEAVEEMNFEKFSSQDLESPDNALSKYREDFNFFRGQDEFREIENQNHRAILEEYRQDELRIIEEDYLPHLEDGFLSLDSAMA